MDDLRVATKVSTNSEFLFFYHPDHLGSAQFITDEYALPHEHLEYFPSGEIWVNEHADPLNTPFLFSGKELDAETGLINFGFRSYDARQGQWISADPILDEMLDLGKLTGDNASDTPFFLPGNVYGYVANNPTNLIDPNGLEKKKRKVIKTRARAAREISSDIRKSSILIKKRIRKSPARLGRGDGTSYGVGQHAMTGVPTKNVTRNFTQKEKTGVNELGKQNGCHTCGIKQSGWPDGHFTPDHQPPLSLVSKLSGYQGNLYPHCKACSSKQGGTLSAMKKAN